MIAHALLLLLSVTCVQNICAQAHNHCEDQLPNDYSPGCSDVIDDVISLHYGKLKLLDSLDTFCAPECQEPLQHHNHYYECLEREDESSSRFLKYAACTVKGEYLCISVLHNANDVLQELNECNSTCTAECVAVLQDAVTVNKIGCCAASYFKYDLYFTSRVYDDCSVDIGEECEMVSSNSLVSSDCGTSSMLSPIIILLAVLTNFMA